MRIKITACVAMMAMAPEAGATPGAPPVFHDGSGASAAGTVGTTAVTIPVEGSLSTDGQRIQEFPLEPSSFTGAGFRWDLSATLTRTRDDYPYWASYARIDVLSATGEVLGRKTTESWKGTTNVTLTWFGDDHPVVRPTRVRFTFSQGASFPYSFVGTVNAVPVQGSNMGGTLREDPLYLTPGSESNPNFVCGDMTLLRENQRFFLYHLQPNESLRALIEKRIVRSTGEGLTFQVWDAASQNSLQTRTYHPRNEDQDVAVYTNEWPVPMNLPPAAADGTRLVVIGISTTSGLSFGRTGFFSVPPATIPAGQPAGGTPPSTTPLVNPFVPGTFTPASPQLVTSAQSVVIPLSSTATRMTRIRVRATRDGFLQTGPGSLVTVTPLDANGAVLPGRRGFTTNYFGPTDYFLEVDNEGLSSTVLPASVLVEVRYEPSNVSLEAMQH